MSERDKASWDRLTSSGDRRIAAAVELEQKSEITLLRDALAKAREEVEELTPCDCGSVYNLDEDGCCRTCGRDFNLPLAWWQDGYRNGGGDAEKLVAAEREVERQANLRRIAEDAIPRGIEVAKEFIRSEYGLRMESSVELATCLSNLLNLTTSQDGGGYCSICNCCHSPDSARCWGTRSRIALTKWSNCQ